MDSELSVTVAVVLAGEIASGKSALSRKLESVLPEGVRISFGDFVRAEAARRKLSQNRLQLQDLGQELLDELGADEFVRQTIQLYGSTQSLLIFDGLRHVEVLTAIKLGHYKTLLVYLDAPPVIRYERYLARGQGQSIETFEQFHGWGEHQVEADLHEIRGLADLIIDNTQPLERSVDEVRSHLADMESNE